MKWLSGDQQTLLIAKECAAVILPTNGDAPRISKMHNVLSLPQLERRGQLEEDGMELFREDAKDEAEESGYENSCQRTRFTTPAWKPERARRRGTIPLLLLSCEMTMAESLEDDATKSENEWKE